MAVINGTNGANTLNGTEDEDVISGLGGNDILRGNGAYDEIYGGDGSDRIYGGSGSDYLLGEAGHDIIQGNGGHDALDGGSGNDELSGGAGDDDLNGDVGEDELRGGAGNDALFGGWDNQDDQLWGEGGNDNLLGDEGDTLRGGTGNDRYQIFHADTTIIERAGEGIDTVVVEGGLTYTLANNIENAEVWGHTTVRGNNLDNFIRSQSIGRDVTLFGGGGNDTLFGSEWAPDILTGGAGRDTFYQTGQHSDEGPDTITDFQAGVDRYAIEWEGYNGYEVGPIDASMFRAGTGDNIAQTPEEVFTFDTETGILYYHPDGSDGASNGWQLAIINVVSGQFSHNDIHIVTPLPSVDF